MLGKAIAAALGLSVSASALPAFGQDFNQFLVFGPSLLDSGYFKTHGGDAHFTAARANGAAITPSGGIMNTDILASRFGLTDVSQGVSATGTNYAVSGARINGPNPLPNTVGTPSITQQMTNYLASTGGVANAKALYVISAGSNDVGFARQTFGFQTPAFFNFLATQAGTFSTAVAQLQSAGAQNILVPNFGDFLSNTIFAKMSAAGVNFIPADQAAMIAAVKANPARFGFTSATPGPVPTSPPSILPASKSACQPPVNGYSGYGLYCIPSTTPKPNVAFQTSANSFQTSFFSDDLHLSPAGQQIQADYYYSLIAAPSQISFLTESAIQFRRGVNLGIEQQIDISGRRTSPGYNVWFNGDVSSLKMGNAAGFPTDPSTPVSGTLGVSYNWNGNALIGAAVTLGSLDPGFSSGGGFKEQEVAASVFGAVRNGALWANAVVSFGWLHYDVNRVVPLGIAFDTNSASTRGQNFSFAGLAGYDFHNGIVTHGPVAGIDLQSVGINSFAETGSFTSLGFANIGRTSAVTELGYRAALEFGTWRPFVQATWNHELETTASKTVTATLTSMTAPSYSLPIVQLGRDWAGASIGTTFTFAQDWTGLAAFDAQLGQNGVTTYGGRIGLNYAFASSAPARLIAR